jgi:uncharacterized membrane protein YbhN (UPF0104 family)
MPVDCMSKGALRVIAATVVALGLWLTLRGVSVPEVLRALSLADLRWVAAGSLALLGLGSVLRTRRYAALLPRGDRRPRFDSLWSSVLLSNAGNNVLPLRTGELLRTRETVALGVPLREVAVAQVAEKLVEAPCILAFAIPVVGTALGQRFHGPVPALVVSGVLAVAGLVAARLARRFQLSARQLGAALVWSLASDAVEVALVALCLHGLGLPSGWLPSVTVFTAVNLAIALPSTPGNLGTLEAGAALPLIAMGVPHDSAVAFALVYRVVQWVPVTLAGAALLVWRAVTPAHSQVAEGGAR